MESIFERKSDSVERSRRRCIFRRRYGEGLAIIPENNILYAPVDGTIAILMEDSRHACGMRLGNGMEILLHVGIDTVDMKGDGFEYLVKEGKTWRQELR